MDYMYIGASGEFCNQAQTKATILTMVDTGAKLTGAVQVDKKGREGSAMRYALAFANLLTEAEITIRTDNEPGIIDMVNFVVEQRKPLKTNVQTVARAEHQSSGRAGASKVSSAPRAWISAQGADWICSPATSCLDGPSGMRPGP